MNEEVTIDAPVRRPIRTRRQVELDRVEIIDLIRRGWTQERIAAKMNLDYDTVYIDYRAVLKQVTAQRTKDAEEVLTAKLMELEEIKIEARAAYERSKKGKVREEEEEITGPKGITSKVRKIRESRLPGAEYLRISLEALAMEIELRGLKPTKELHVTGQIDLWSVLSTGILPEGQTRETIEEEMQRLLKGPPEIIEGTAERVERKDDGTPG